MIIRPFDNRDSSGFDVQYLPEKERNFTKEYEGSEGKVRWFKPESKQKDGFVNLVSLMKPNEWAAAYAVTYVHSPKARQVQFRIGSDEDIKSWLNGQFVLSRNVGRYAAMDHDIIPVSLKCGRNEILLKVCNRTGSWGFYIRITNESGKPYDNLHFSTGSANSTRRSSNTIKIY